MQEQGEGQWERENLHKLPAEQGAQCRAPSRDPESMT